MARNLSCGCLCHGSNGNRIGDEYFSCKGCYAANHMDHLPRKVVQTKPVAKGPRKPRPVGKDAVIKAAAKAIMNDLADAATKVKYEFVQKTAGTSSMTVPVAPTKKFTPEQADRVTVALKDAMEAVHVCGDGEFCKHE